MLNQFRQDHGYKEGTYKKVWGGKEDNTSVMLSLLQGDKVPTIDALYHKLENLQYIALVSRIFLLTGIHNTATFRRF